MIEKPPYRVPSMDEVRALPWNGYTAISTFSGTGGSSTGYRMAGFRVLWASEFIDAARESYSANAAPYTVVDGRDIRLVQAEDILKATGLKVGELDLFDGSPPCASFSTAGKREAGWGKAKAYSDKHQRTDDLFFEYARLLRGLQPKTFVAENVSGLIKGTAKGYFLDILKELKACGYRVEAKVLDAQWLGVPQARQRLIFVGVRNDLGLAPAFPVPRPYRYTVRDALPHIGSGRLVLGDPAHKLKPGSNFERGKIVGFDEPCMTVKASPAGISGAAHSLELDSRFPPATRVIHDTSGLFGAGNITDRPSPSITVGVNSVNSLHFKVENECHNLELPPSRAQAYDGKDAFNFTLCKENAPAPTVTVASPGNDMGHPTERRKFTIAELRRICAFPDDFILTGSYGQQWERCGRAVPPVMMKAIGEAVRDGVLNRLRPDQKAGPALLPDAAD